MAIKKAYTVFFAALMLLAGLFTAGRPASAAETDSLNLKGEAAILIDADTGKILYEKNADELLGVASMSKMMTEYLVLEAIKENRLSWDDEVVIDEDIHNLSKAPDLSNVGLTQGEAYTVKELYEAMVIHSGNAAAVALAQKVAGSEKEFVKLMNEKAAELELGDYYFVNATGLNNSDLMGNYPAGEPNDENKMSARATAKLAYRLLKDFPEVLETTGRSEFTFRDGRTYKNFNWMLPGLIFEYQGVDGLKTGSTDYAGYCFTATAKRDGQRFISVIMKTSSQAERFSETRKLLDYAFSTFSKVELFPKGMKIKGTESLPVIRGKSDQVKIATAKPLSLVIDPSEKDSYVPKLVLDKDKFDADGNLTAPVKKGDVVGYVTYEYKGDQSDYGFIDSDQPIKVNVVAAETVEKANWFVLMMRGIGGFFSGLWEGITSTVSGWLS